MALQAILGIGVSALTGSAVGALTGSLSRSISYKQNEALPNENYGYDTYLYLYQLGWIERQTFTELVLKLGYDVPAIDPSGTRMFQNINGIVDWDLKLNETWESPVNEKILTAIKNLPDTSTTFDLVNRGLITPSVAHYIVNAQFPGEKPLAEAIYKLKDQIPGAGDLVSFAVRDCFTPEIVSTFQYNKELPTAILPYMKAQGLGGIVDVKLPSGSTTTEGADTRTQAQWFDLYWWSHWELPSIQQGYEMLQRLYPTSIYGPNPDVDAKLYFSQDNLTLLQKANDYPPFWRDRLTALSYLPLQKRDILKLYKYGQLKDNPNDRSLFHAIKSLGYSDTNTLKLVEMIKEDSVASTKDLALGQAKEMYKYGLIQESDFRYYLQKLEYRVEEIDLIISSENFYLKTEQFKDVIPLVKKAVINGDLSLEEARGLLANFNIWTQRINDLLQIWTLEIKVQHRFASAQQILTYYKNGILPEAQARLKLSRMYYKPDEIDLMITNVKLGVLRTQLELSEKSAKQLDKLQSQLDKQNEKAALATQKNLAAISKASQKAITDASKKAKAPFSETNLKAFAKANYMTYGQLVKVLTDKGWLLPDIQRWILTYAPDVKGIPNGIKEEYETTGTGSKS